MGKLLRCKYADVGQHGGTVYKFADLATYSGDAEPFSVSLSKAKREKVTWLQVFDPNDNSDNKEPLAQFPVIRGSLKTDPKGPGHPAGKLTVKFRTRCYLTAPPYIEVKLVLKSGANNKGVQIEEYEIQGMAIKNRPLTELAACSFAQEFISDSSPDDAVRKLGLRIKFGKEFTGHDPNPQPIKFTLVTTAGLWGFRFEAAFRLKPEAQYLTPFGFGFPSKETHETVTIVQRPPSTKNEELLQDYWHTILEVKLADEAVYHGWNHSFAVPYRDALATVRDGAHATFLPDFSATSAGGWQATVSFLDCNKSKSTSGNYRFYALGNPVPSGDTVNGLVWIVPRCLVPSRDCKAEISFPAIGGTDSIPPLACDLSPLKDGKGDDERDLRPSVNGFVFLVKTPPGQAAKGRLRLGSLDFGIGGTVAAEMEGRIHASFRMRPDENGEYWPALPRLVECNLQIPIEGMTPGGQDPLPGEEYAERDTEFEISGQKSKEQRQQPLLLPVARVAQAGDGRPPSELTNAYLDITERAFEQQSQTIDVRLKADPKPMSFDLLVVDPEPLLIAKVSAALSFAGDTSREIGNWDNRSPALIWELKIADRKFTLWLPPQTIGEAMHRRRGEKDVVAGEPVQFRFGSPLKAELESSYFEQQFVEAPWNLRRILGYPGQRDPGARIRTLEFELLYGILGTVANPALRLAEIQSRMGEMPPALSGSRTVLRWPSSEPQGRSWSVYLNRWQGLHQTLLRRPAVLEPWWPPLREVSRSKTAPQDRLLLTEKHELTFQLRENAELFNKKDNPNGLKGSYAWAIESENVLGELTPGLPSSSGELSAPLFSSFGGWGRQVARFKNDTTAIISETEMGRVSSLTVERIGRIGVYRNKAKHVIVYRRTVAPTRQFALQQEPFLGSPILRKAEEFIELIEPVRSFQNRGAQAQKAGFVRALSFPDGPRPRIPVDSTWGENTPNGWKIPLWRPGAHPADVYPRPAVDFLFEGRTEDDRVRGPNGEPDKIWFYTWTNEKATSDTELWDAERGVDYGEVWLKAQDNERWEGLETAKLAGTPDEFHDAPSAYFPGMEAFTWAVEAEGGASMTAARGANAVLSTPRTVTLMWGTPNAVKPENSQGRCEAAVARQTAAELVLALRGAVDLQQKTPDPQQAAARLDAARKLGKGYRDASNRALDKVRGQCDTAVKAVEAVNADVRSAAAAALQKCQGEAKGFFENLKQGLSLETERGEVALRWRLQKRAWLEEANAFRTKVRGLSDLAFGDVSATLEAAEVVVLKKAGELEGVLGTGALVLDVVKKRIETIRDGLNTACTHVVDKLNPSLAPEWLKPRAQELVDRIEALRAAAVSPLNGLLESLSDATLPDKRAAVRAAAWKAAGVLTSLRAQVAGVQAEINSRIEHFGDSEISASAGAIESKLAEIDELIIDEKKEIKSWEDLLKAVDTWVRHVSVNLDELIKKQEESVNAGAKALHAWCELLDPKAAGGQLGAGVCDAAKIAVKRQIDLMAKPLEAAADALADRLADAIKWQLEQAKPAAEFSADAKKKLMEQVAKARAAAGSGLDFTASQVAALAAVARDVQKRAFADAVKPVDALIAAVDQWSTPADKSNAKVPVVAAFAKAGAELGQAEAAASAVARRYTAGSLDRLQSEFRVLRLRLEAAQSLCLEWIDSLSCPLEYAKSGVTKELEGVKNRLGDIDRVLSGRLAGLEDGARASRTELEGKIDSVVEQVEQIILALPDDAGWKGFLEEVDAAVANEKDALKNAAKGHIAQLNGAIDGWGDLCNSTMASVGDLATLARSVLGKDVVDGIVRKLGNDVAAAARSLEEDARRLADDAARVLQRLELSLPPIPQIDLPQGVSGALRLIRAFGDVPRVPQLDFNVEKMAFHFLKWPSFDAVKDKWLPALEIPHVDLSRIAAQVNKGLELPSMGITMPAVRLGDVIGKLPDVRLGDVFGTPDLSGFDPTKLLHKIAGLEMGNLCKGLKLPRLNERDVQITHGEDLATRSGWVRVEVDFSLPSPVDIFNFGGMVLSLQKGKVKGRIYVEGGLNRPAARREWGQLSGDWEIRAGNLPVVVLRGAALTKEESGRVDFNVSADKVELQQSLAFLNDLMKPFAEPGNGLSFDFSPKGAMVRLDLPLPDYQAGSFGIANLTLGFYFGALLQNGALLQDGFNLQNGFKLQTGLRLARPDRPFTLTIFILGGSGYLDLAVDYTPATGVMESHLDLGMFASASLAIALGPVKGGVYAYFGLEAHYRASTASGTDLYIAIVLMFNGNVSLLGFLSVSLSLRMQATQRGSKLIGRGTISFSIRLGPFWTVNVNSAVEYEYGNPPHPPQARKLDAVDLEKLANEYYDLFIN